MAECRDVQRLDRTEKRFLFVRFGRIVSKKIFSASDSEPERFSRIFSQRFRTGTIQSFLHVCTKQREAGFGFIYILILSLFLPLG